MNKPQVVVIYNIDQANALVKNGGIVLGFKKHKETKKIGIVFKNDDRHDLHEKLSLCINNKEQIRKGLEHRLEYSKSIQGPAVANYFINCLFNVWKSYIIMLFVNSVYLHGFAE